ncbi:hypothetical protein NC653_020328 [Populus alba x Populus x berolinensis]|uniref:Uncharacterized protein n=1 Tax=Populus alba x Populus x berolinensis TaxID=444605 RepID=A0AAD6QC99_9ROSI|nr:hypothetical protein NC653_020328 [Populus alba x Populus x berolinensis]
MMTEKPDEYKHMLQNLIFKAQQSNNEKLLENPYLQVRGLLQLSNDGLPPPRHTNEIKAHVNSEIRKKGSGHKAKADVAPILLRWNLRTEISIFLIRNFKAAAKIAC